jgi:hypothetical protein
MAEEDEDEEVEEIEGGPTGSMDGPLTHIRMFS